MFSSLKSKLIVPIVAALVAMVVVIVVYVSVQTSTLVSDLTQDRIAVMSNAVTSRLSALEEQMVVITSIAASSYEFLSNLNSWNDGIGGEETRQVLLEYLRNTVQGMGVTNIVVRDATGTIIVRTHDGTFETAPDAALNGIMAMAGESSSSFSSTAVMPLGLNATVPVWLDGEVVGTFGTNYFLSTDDFVDYFADTFGAQVTVYAGNRRVATTFRDDAGRRAIGTTLDDSYIIDLVQAQRQIHIAEQVMFGGNRYYGYFSPLLNAAGNAVGMLYVGFPTESTHAAVNAMQVNLLVIGVVSLIVVAIVMFLFAMKMLKPLDLLTRNLNDIANGDADLTKRLPITGKDEIAKASGYFNQTMEQFRTLIVSIKQQAGTLSDIGSNLASNMVETASAMNQISANIQSIKGRVLNQSASVPETNATMEQVTVNINKLNGQVDNQTGAVSQASSALEQMIANIQSVTATLTKNTENVRELQDASATGKASLQEVAHDIQDIVRESEGLLEINAVMENIASQTNLLSMNAAIEAARAGELGRGFAVVAGEIRQLAENSGNQSKTIGDVLKKIKDSMDKITRSTDNVLTKFEAIDQGVKTVAEQEEVIRRAMEEQGHGSRQVLSASGQVGDITGQVRGSSIEMLEGSKEVIAESKNLERATQEITNGINEMAAGTEQVNKAVNTANDLSGRTQENISTLTRAVSQFKV